MNTAAYVRNRLPSRSIDDQIPEEVWSGRKVNLSNLRIFGCLAYAHVPKEKRDSKWDERAVACIFVGYSETQKAYRLLELNNPKNVIFARDVVFAKLEKCANKRGNLSNSVSDCVVENPHPQNFYFFWSVPKTVQSIESPSSINSNEIGDSDHTVINHCSNSSFESTGTNSVPAQIENVSDVTERRYPLRLRKQTEHFGFSAGATSDPQSASEALSSSECSSWQQAMDEEFRSLSENETWSLVDRPRDSNVVESKWVFKRKLNSNGQIRYKARLVASVRYLVLTLWKIFRLLFARLALDF